MRMCKLEERILFDGAAAVDMEEQLLTDNFNDSLSIIDQQPEIPDFQYSTSFFPDSISFTEVAFIDSAVQDFQTIVDSLDEKINIVYLNSGESGIQQITDYLSAHDNVSSIHVISEGNYSQIMLGKDIITANNIEEYKDSLSSWQGHLSANADILFYGCDIAKDNIGQNILGKIAEYTGTDINASTDTTGIQGNWNLEYSIGAIQTASISISDYDHNLETYTVTSITDTGNEIGTEGKLSWAITQSNLSADIDDNIAFNLNTDNTVTISGTLPTITDSVTIDGTNINTGNNVTVQVTEPGVSTFRVFNINAPTSNADHPITIENMTIKGGDISSYGDLSTEVNYGGGIYVASGMLELNNSTISDSKASSGGGIYIEAGTLTITDSMITRNSGFFDGYGYPFGGGIYISLDATAEIISSTITENSIFYYGYGYGGGIYNEGILTITNSTISGNTSFIGGGISNWGGTLTITDSTISENTSYVDGGVSSVYGALTITDSTISGNSVHSGGGIGSYNDILTIINSTINDNSATMSGGGMWNWESTITITNSTISGNSASNGGGILNEGTLIITDSTISGNSADSGAGIYSSGVGDSINDITLIKTYLTNSIVAYNYNTDKTAYLDIHKGAESTIYGNYNITNFTEWTTPGEGNIEYVYTNGKGAKLFADYETIVANTIYKPVLANNGGNTHTIALALDSIASGAGVITGTYNNGADYAFWNGVKWAKVEDGTALPDGTEIHEITKDQRSVERLDDNPCAGAYYLASPHSDYYYRTNKSGSWDWNTAAGWQQSEDGKTWTTAIEAPDSSSLGIEIRKGANVSVSSTLSVDQTTVDKGGTITVTAVGKLTVDDGEGTDLTINGTVFVSTNTKAGITGTVVNEGNIDNFGTFTNAGTVTNNGTFTSETGSTFSYISGNQDVFGGTYYNLVLSGSGTVKTAVESVTVTNALNANKNVEFDVTDLTVTKTITNSGSIYASGAVSLPAKATVGGLFAYDGEDQSIFWNASYKDLSILGSGTTAAENQLIVKGTLIVGSDSILDATSITISKNVANSGTIYASDTVKLPSYATIGGIFVYNGMDQTVVAVNYNQLGLTGSGTKTFASGVTSVSNAIIVTDELAIQGTIAKGKVASIVQVLSPGKTISRVFDTDMGEGKIASISNLNIKGGNISSGTGESGYGGAIYAESGTLNISNVAISGSKAVSGGGIYISGGMLNLQNSTISGNSATISGGGISNAEGTLSIDRLHNSY